MNSTAYSKRIAERFEGLKIWRRALALLYLVIYLIYLGWRITIFGNHSFLLSFFYFLAECFGFILSLTIILNSWKYRHREVKKSPSGLDVDVFILTYQEPIEIIKKTIQAAKNIDYPHQVWVLDDGRRDEVKAIAQSIGVNYNARPSNTNAKAGNLNFGLSLSTAEFIMIFDADHIALPHALDVTLGFFDDEKVGMVQTPQDYYNTDAFQYINFKNNKIWHDQSFFYNISQSCQDAFDSSSCVGTGVVYRRSILDEIGGFPTLTVTEDIHTSLKMNKAGYKTVYLNESIAYGIAASDLTEYYKTRHRWAHGNLHALKYEKILTCKGLTWKQRIAYLSLGLIYLEGWQKLFLFLIPVITLIFGIPPFEISIFNILVVLLFPFFSYLMLQEIGCGFSNFWANELFAIVRWPIHIVSTASLFGKKISWVSSSKKIKSEVNWLFMLPQISILVISVTSIIIAIIKLKSNYQSGPIIMFFYNYFKPSIPIASHAVTLTTGVISKSPAVLTIYNTIDKGYSIDLVLIAGLWVLYTIIKIVFFILKVLHNVKKSTNYFQFKIPFQLLVNGVDNGKVLKISEDSIIFNVAASKISNYNKQSLKKVLLQLTNTALEFSINITNIALSKKNESALIEAKIVWSSELDREVLGKCLYSVNWHRALFSNENNIFFRTFGYFIFNILNFKNSNKLEHWSPFVFAVAKEEIKKTKCAFVSKINIKARLSSIAAFEQLDVGETILVYRTLSLEKNENPLKFTILQEEFYNSFARKNLDKSIMHRYLVQLI
jgi:cellulose synthase (UDP-forming)